ncbi:MAG: type I 3-dehydroquinate dehydratase [Candidatus Ratteibacteria bacterium]|nr:type I 3-dehydroquinate dehydratase [Candidatus Ratteibacteria bacterium]
MKEKLALVLVGGEDQKEVNEALKRCGWCEFRVDEFLKKFPEDKLIEYLSIKTTAKKIGTIRWQKEHQNRGLSIPEDNRLKIYKDILKYVDYVDVEIRSRIVREVIKEARKTNRKVIVSYHNFSKTPPFKTLEVIHRKGKQLKPDIIKIATRANTPDELFTLLSFTYKYSKSSPLVVTPMGTSLVERLVPLSLGSLFTYIAFTTETAPGQISYRDMDILKKLT